RRPRGFPSGPPLRGRRRSAAAWSSPSRNVYCMCGSLANECSFAARTGSLRGPGRLTSREPRWSLLEGRPLALPAVVAQRDERDLALQELERRPELHVLLAVEGIPAQAHDGRRLDRQLAGQAVRDAVQVCWRDDAVDQAQVAQLAGGPSAAQHEHLEHRLA